MNPQSLSVPLALLAGLLSFVSPCVLPLVPAYVGYLTGQATSTISSTLAAAGASVDGGATAGALEAKPNRWLVLLHGLFFVLGFGAVFILVFGFGAGLLGQISNDFVSVRRIISQIGGLLVIVLGLHVMGVIQIPFLHYDTRRQAPPRKELGLLGSSVMGVTFAAGWSPCIGPILSAVVALAGTSGSFNYSTLLLGAYTIGLGMPFLLTAFLLDGATAQFRRLQKHMRTIEIASGILVIAIGLLLFTGYLQQLSSWLSAFTGITTALDKWLIGLTGGGR